MIARIVDWVKIHQRDILLAAAMGLIGWSFFNIGRLTSGPAHDIAISPGPAGARSPVRTEHQAPLDARVVTSKNSDKYHYSWCGSGRRIKEQNRLWFESAAAAESAGYTLAGNCR